MIIKKRFPEMPFHQFRAWVGLTNTIYISPDGSDSNPGTRRKPVRTIERAMAVMQDGDFIRVHCGKYGKQDVKVQAEED